MDWNGGDRAKQDLGVRLLVSFSPFLYQMLRTEHSRSMSRSYTSAAQECFETFGLSLREGDADSEPCVVTAYI